MKKTILMLLVSVVTLGATAQSTKRTVGGAGAAITEITWVNGKPALNLGGYGGVLLNKQLLIGVAGNNIFFRQTVNNKKQDFQFNYYGLYTEYKFVPQKNVHLSLGLTGAMGWQENNVETLKKSRKRDGDFTYVVQPKLAVNVKIASFIQVQGYTNYRFTGKTNSTYYSANNYNGLSAGVGLVFGTF